MIIVNHEPRPSGYLEPQIKSTEIKCHKEEFFDMFSKFTKELKRE